MIEMTEEKPTEEEMNSPMVKRARGKFVELTIVERTKGKPKIDWDTIEVITTMGELDRKKEEGRQSALKEVRDYAKGKEEYFFKHGELQAHVAYLTVRKFAEAKLKEGSK